MIRHDVPQGGVDWLALRIGRPTASQFSRLITAKKMERSTSAEGYLSDLLAEWLLGEPLDFDASQYMDRGTALEDEARRYYEFEEDCTVEQVGFLTDDVERYGCSPDGLRPADKIGLEIKCLGPSKHVQCLLAHARGESLLDFREQCQGGLLVTEYDRWDLLLYHPRLPKLLIRQTPDDIWRAKFTPILDRFCAELAEAKETAITQGWHPPDDGVSSWLKRALTASLQEQRA